MTIAQAYKKIVGALNTEEREQEAAEILRCLTGFDKGELFLKFDVNFLKEEELRNIIERRSAGEPLAYILNKRSFYGYDFYVDERCLIPRYDSECLAEYAVLLIKERGYKKILDLCSGSGCLGISIETECRDLSGNETETEFSDISAEAMEVCKKNAKSLLNREPKCYIGSLYIPEDEKYDLIICNPPYIDMEKKSEIEKQVADYEPHIALFAGDRGLELYPEITEKSFKSLSVAGALICEIGCGQAGAVKEIFAAGGFKNVRVGRDLASRDRFICGEK